MTTNQSPKRAVDLDLDDLAPPTRTFRLKGEVYELPGEIPIPTVINALQAMGRLESDEGTGTDAEKATEAFTEMYAIVMGLLRETNPDVGDLPLGTSQVQALMGLITGGGATLPDAVLETLRKDGAETDGDGKVKKLPPTRGTTKRQKKRAGSRSRKRSPVRS